MQKKHWNQKFFNYSLEYTILCPLIGHHINRAVWEKLSLPMNKALFRFNSNLKVIVEFWSPQVSKMP